MQAIIGLGNPGERYRETRHNIGWAVVEQLSATLRLPLAQRLLDTTGQVAARYGTSVGAGSEPLLLAVPTTFMNDSGAAVERLTLEQDVSLEHLLIVCDDVSLPLGRLRLRPMGSHGGHHGLESIISRLGTNAFPRLRIGIAAPQMPRDVTAFVLEPFAVAERPQVEGAITRAAAACCCWTREGITAAMNRFNPRQEE